MNIPRFFAILLAILALMAGFPSMGQANGDFPVPSCDRIDYSQPATYLSLGPNWGNPGRIRAIAAEVQGATPEEKLMSIHRWIQAKLVLKQDVPYEWRNFDRLISDGNYGGCADYSVVFGALARGCGIPTVWVKTLDCDWIRGYRTRGEEGNWNGHVFLEVYLRDRWVLLDDVQMVLYEDYDPRMRILPGNRYAYDKGGDPFDLVLSSRWELWKAQTRAFCRDLDLAKLPVGAGKPLTKYPAVFLFFSKGTSQIASKLSKSFYPKLTQHLTGRPHSVKDYREQFTRWVKPGDTVILLLLVSEKDQIPAEYQDLLPKPWTEIEAEVALREAARFDGEGRKVRVVLLVAKTQTGMETLIREIQW